MKGVTLLIVLCGVVYHVIAQTKFGPSDRSRGNGKVPSESITGCTNTTACNFNPLATTDDGTCAHASSCADCDGVSSCLNEGECAESGDSFECTCLNGWTGDTCEYDQCYNFVSSGLLLFFSTATQSDDYETLLALGVAECRADPCCVGEGEDFTCTCDGGGGGGSGRRLNDACFLGDATGDGNVNVVDVVTMVYGILGETSLTEDQTSMADLNSDGTVNVADIVAVVNIILGSDSTALSCCEGYAGENCEAFEELVCDGDWNLLDAIDEGCTTVTGNVSLESSDHDGPIVAPALTSVGEDFFFKNNHAVTSLECNQLHSVGESFFFKNNSALISTEFNQLQSAGGGWGIEFFDNPALTSVGFEKLQSVNGSFEFNRNNALISIECNQLLSANSLLFEDNNALTSAGFEKLQSVEASVGFKHNDALISVDCNQLQSVGRYFEFFDNSALTSVGFEKLQIVGDWVRFWNNDVFISIEFNQLQSIDLEINFYNNPALTSVGFEKLQSVGNFWFYDNPAVTSMNFGQLQDISSVLNGDINDKGDFRIDGSPLLGDNFDFSALQNVSGAIIFNGDGATCMPYFHVFAGTHPDFDRVLCVPCSCEHGACIQNSTGTCDGSCDPGYYSSYTDSPNCDVPCEGDHTTGPTCSDCLLGYYMAPSDVCLECNCINGNCDQTTGQCTLDENGNPLCDEGYTGNSCNVCTGTDVCITLVHGSHCDGNSTQFYLTPPHPMGVVGVTMGAAVVWSNTLQWPYPDSFANAYNGVGVFPSFPTMDVTGSLATCVGSSNLYMLLYKPFNDDLGGPFTFTLIVNEVEYEQVLDIPATGWGAYVWYSATLLPENLECAPDCGDWLVGEVVEPDDVHCDALSVLDVPTDQGYCNPDLSPETRRSLSENDDSDDCFCCLDRFSGFPLRVGSLIKMAYSSHFADITDFTDVDASDACTVSDMEYGPTEYNPTHDVKIRQIMREDNGASMWSKCQSCPIADFSTSLVNGACHSDLTDAGCQVIGDYCICASIDKVFNDVKDLVNACVKIENQALVFPQRN